MNIASDGKIFDPTSEPLSKLLEGIHEHSIALPDFQRGWVWEPEMVQSLLISVAYRYPAGSLLTMPVADEGFALRSFEGSGDLGDTQPALMVLDGQQRLTSLYQATWSRDGVRHKGRVYRFYLDVPELMSDEDGDITHGDPHFETALFSIAEQKGGRRIRYENLEERYEITTPEQELEHGTLPLWMVFDAQALSQWAKQYLRRRSGEDWAVYDELDTRWRSLVQPWLDRIRTYPFPAVRLDKDMPLGAICHIFEKVNSTGVSLGVFDLCNAILWAQGFQMSREWDALLRGKRLRRFREIQEPDGAHFLQGLSLLNSWHRKYVAGEPRVVQCRKQDLMRLDESTVRRYWDALVAGYEEVASFMANEGVLSDRILPYATMTGVLAAILANVRLQKGEAHVGACYDKLSRWYWCSVFTQRYSGQVETRAAQDMEQVLAWLDGGSDPDCVRNFAFRSDLLQEVCSLKGAIYKGMLCLMARNGAADWGGKGKLSVQLWSDSNQDHHHIFPRNALKTLGIEDPRSDTIINKTLISSAVNRSIGGRLPSDYCRTLSNSLGEDGTTALDAYLTSHAVPPSRLRSDDWGGFVRERRELLKALIEQACGRPCQPFEDDIVVEEPEDDDR